MRCRVGRVSKGTLSRPASSNGSFDAFDFFLLVFVLKDIARDFNTQITEVTFAILLTLAMRPYRLKFIHAT